MENSFYSKPKSIFSISQISSPKNDSLNLNISNSAEFYVRNISEALSQSENAKQCCSNSDDGNTLNMNSNFTDENMGETETNSRFLPGMHTDTLIPTNSNSINPWNMGTVIPNKHDVITSKPLTKLNFEISHASASDNGLNCTNKSLASQMRYYGENNITNKTKSLEKYMPNESIEFTGNGKENCSNSTSLQTLIPAKRTKPNEDDELSSESATNNENCNHLSSTSYEVRNNIGEKSLLFPGHPISGTNSNNLHSQYISYPLRKDLPKDMSRINRREHNRSVFSKEALKSSSSCNSNINSIISTQKSCGHSNVEELFPSKAFLRNTHNTKRANSKKLPTKSKSTDDISAFKNTPRNEILAVFIQEFLKSTHPNLHLTNSVCQRIEIFLRDILFRLGDEAEALMTLSKSRTFNPRVLKYAIKLCLHHIKDEADVVTGRKTSWIF